MKLCQIMFNTNDVVTLSYFYKQLLGVESDSGDKHCRVLPCGDIRLVIYNDCTHKYHYERNITLSFRVDDVYGEYDRLLALGAQVVGKPEREDDGTVSLSFFDPDHNLVCLYSTSQ